MVYHRLFRVDEGASHKLCWFLLKSKEKNLEYKIGTAEVFPLSVVMLTLLKVVGKSFLLVESTNIF